MANGQCLWTRIEANRLEKEMGLQMLLSFLPGSSIFIRRSRNLFHYFLVKEEYPTLESDAWWN